MRNELVAPIELAPELRPDTTAEESVRIWIDLMKATDKLVWAGLCREAGPESVGDAYRRWCAEYLERRSVHLVALARRLRTAGE